MYAAKIEYLFNTDREIITWGDIDGLERPSSFAELKKDKSVLVGDISIPGTKIREVIIGDDCYLIEPNSYNHTGGKMLFLEVIQKIS